MSIDAKLAELDITLPKTPSPIGNYIGGVVTGNLLFMSGVGPRKPDGGAVTGKVGADLTTEEAYDAARLVGLNMLANMKSVIGDLDRVTKIVKVLGMVNAVPDFKEHPKVINGYSDLMVEVFGDKAGKAARSAVGMGSLPNQIAVEIEMIVEITD
ncbi:RidA family protein [uncultured Sneathiella sp.]|uniref:RidA family protein n=1 Tax=uncultured Sneathiella sp. TaxID=879315 RepID=UPI0030D8FA56|tara:strand:- start:564 stop:1028 length:465 start_codon:yes stop_codon:yes gene_type:complete